MEEAAPRATTQQNGFTLIELSIVLVIIGLLVGGILVGRDLIKSSEIRAQISQIEEFKTAVNTFRVKYGYLPGDMPPSQASQLGFFTFTGAYAGKGCGSNAYGNNDGIINSTNEFYVFWSHLADAKLLKGNYGGTAGSLLQTSASPCSTMAGYPISSPSTHADFARLQPYAKISASPGFVFVSGNYPNAPDTSSVIYSGVKKDNMFVILDPVAGFWVLTPYELSQIDTKMDDGFPATGDVRDYLAGDFGTGTPHADPTCTTSVLPLAYDVSPSASNTRRCEPAFYF